MAGLPAKVWTGSEWVPIAVAQLVDSEALTAASASAIYAPLDSATFTGTIDFSGATVVGIDALPDQTGNAGKILTTNGTSASWGSAYVTVGFNTYGSIKTSYTYAQLKDISQRSVVFS